MIGMAKTHHNRPAIASGLIASEMRAFIHEWASFGGLEFEADKGRARPFAGAISL